MVVNLFNYLKNSPISIIIGAILGAVSAGSIQYSLDAAIDAYDATHPVWEKVQTKIISRADNYVDISIEGIKKRNCRYLRVNAVSAYAAGGTVDAKITRLDIPVTGYNRPLGEHFLGIWRIEPVPPLARQVLLFTEHDCNGRTVVSLLAKIPLANE
jgi:hypothetical protein